MVKITGSRVTERGSADGIWHLSAGARNAAVFSMRWNFRYLGPKKRKKENESNRLFVLHGDIT